MLCNKLIRYTSSYHPTGAINVDGYEDLAVVRQSGPTDDGFAYNHVSQPQRGLKSHSYHHHDQESSEMCRNPPQIHLYFYIHQFPNDITIIFILHL